MSIFEPIPRESRWDDVDVTAELDEDGFDDVAVPAGGPSDPRSMLIAGGVVAAIVVGGLVVANLAEPESQRRPLVVERADPGAAAVEQVEAERPAPTADTSDEASDEDVSESASNSDDATSSDDGKRDERPHKGHGRGHR